MPMTGISSHHHILCAKAAAVRADAVLGASLGHRLARPASLRDNADDADVIITHTYDHVRGCRQGRVPAQPCAGAREGGVLAKSRVVSPALLALKMGRVWPNIKTASQTRARALVQMQSQAWEKKGCGVRGGGKEGVSRAARAQMECPQPGMEGHVCNNVCIGEGVVDEAEERGEGGRGGACWEMGVGGEEGGEKEGQGTGGVSGGDETWVSGGGEGSTMREAQSYLLQQSQSLHAGTQRSWGGGILMSGGFEVGIREGAGAALEIGGCVRAVDVAPLPPMDGWHARGWHGSRVGPQVRIWNTTHIRATDIQGFRGRVQEGSGGEAAPAGAGSGGGGARTQGQELILTHKGFVFLGRLKAPKHLST
jgi:hypothetical protein